MKKSFPLSDPSESPLEAPTNGLYLSIKSQEKDFRWYSPFYPSHWLEDRCSDRDTSNHFDSDVTLVMEIARGRVTQRRSLLPYTCELLTNLALATSSLLNTQRKNLFLLHVIPVFCFFFLPCYPACGILVPRDWIHTPCIGSTEF